MSSWKLSNLNPYTFEHLVNRLAMRVLGAGHTGFGPGPDGGRDGYFQGEAPYPSDVDRWKGTWIVQSKFHAPSLSKNAQKWLLSQIKDELALFANPQSDRKWPDNWIVATNIDVSGASVKGTFDQARAQVKKARPRLAGRFHLWGGDKILSLLDEHKDIAAHYGDFLTPGHVITYLISKFKQEQASVERILQALVVRQFSEQQFTKLEQAGSPSDSRPGIHKLFIDVPFFARGLNLRGLIFEHLCSASAQVHRPKTDEADNKLWLAWRQHPKRARTWFVRGGPGRGKSTLSQFLSQIHRAALILDGTNLQVPLSLKTLAREVKEHSEPKGFWPTEPRIPVVIELKEYASWLSRRTQQEPHGILTYLSHVLHAAVEQTVSPGIILEMLRLKSWFFAFDGLDEVPQDAKDKVASEIMTFIDHVAFEAGCDLFSLCTSRPQGYSGQFTQIDGPTLDLIDLDSDQALACARPILGIDRSHEEAQRAFDTLRTAINSDSVRQLMTTPLQSHIMAVVVREGGRPPERRWQLFTNFYNVIRRREANRDLPDSALARLLREDERLLKVIHNRLGFVLHAQAETSSGAEASLPRDDFRRLVYQTVSQLQDTEIEETVELLMRATTERLVLVNTPEQSDKVRFDVRPLQEFFAAEFLYEGVTADTLRARLETVGGDSHWHEVMHFLQSALIECSRLTEIYIAAQTLTELNQPKHGGYPALVEMRMARGALMAVRLLREGVLEQDKRIRQHFGQALSPLTALAENAPVSLMSHVTQTQSRAWLVDYLLSSLKTKQFSETIGAAIALSFLLKDHDTVVEEYLQFIDSAPTEYRAFVLFQRLRGFPRRRSAIPRSIEGNVWLYKYVLSFLRRPDWHAHNGETLVRCIYFIAEDRLIIRDTVKRLGLPRYIEDALVLLQPLYTKRALGNRMHRIGLIDYITYQKDWTTGLEGETSIKNASIAQLKEVGGVFSFVFLVVDFAKNRRREALAKLCDYSLHHPHALEAISSSSLKAFIPVGSYDSPEEDLVCLASLDEDGFDELMRNRSLGGRQLPRPFEVENLREGSCSIEDWNRMFDFAPILALHDLFRHSGIYDGTSISNSLDSIREKISKVLTKCRVLQDFVHAWGALIKAAGEKEDLVRSTLVQCAKGPPTSSSFQFSEDHYYMPRLEPFKLDLPNENGLLPHILNALALAIPTASELPASTSYETAMQTIRNLAGSFISSSTSLKDIIEDCTINENTRIAAAVLLEVADPAGFRADRLQECIGNIGVGPMPTWLAHAFSRVIRLFIRAPSEADMALLGQLLDINRDQYFSLEVLSRVIFQWREVSNAPLSRSRATDIWLAADA